MFIQCSGENFPYLLIPFQIFNILTSIFFVLSQTSPYSNLLFLSNLPLPLFFSLSHKPPLPLPLSPVSFYIPLLCIYIMYCIVCSQIGTDGVSMVILFNMGNMGRKNFSLPRS
uniref:Uncharacterized protein n=1 Tax=Cacopsylla melanoneura TaxID=428564 RepID=A0A8D9EFC9_9HEMI